ncbi:MAG: AEC family transporter [Marivibrio sp.]|uniref:AEC family transporter n=1 Tax=Marivibrio sp. TaxID=2039719 RepID=UPI0032EFAAA0
MTAFLAALAATLPFFAVIGCGAAARWRGLMDERAVKGVHAFVFYFALPCLIFRAFATRDLGEILRIDYLLAYGVPTLLVYLAAVAAGVLVFRLKLGEAALHGQAGAVSNAGFLGIPLIVGVMGEAAAPPVVIAILWDLVVTITLSILLLEVAEARAAQAGRKIGATVLQALKGAALNPFVLSIAAGVGWSATGLALPGPIAVLIGLLADAAGPAALFALGAGLWGRPISKGLGEVASMSLFKLVVHPLAVWLVCFQLFPVDPFWAAAGVLTAALPVAANVFIIGGRYGRYVARGSTAILISTLIAVVTTPLAILWLGVG